MTGAPSPRHVDRSRSRSAPPLVACPRTGDLPLSFAQQRLWFIEQLEPGSASYNVSFLFELHAPLDVQALRRALQDIVQRHEVLRTSFPEVLGDARQVIAAPDELALPIESLEAIPEREQREQREALAARARLEARRPFDLAHGPLVRAKLLRLASDRHALVVVTHHIVCDNWSMGILARELGALYGALVSGGEPPLPPLPVQYADFAVWQRGWLDDTELARLLGYWRGQLADLPAILDLPTDRPRPALRSGRGARLYPALPRELVGALGAFSRQEGATLYMTLLAAFDTLLWRYSGQHDIVVGAPIAGRNRRELEGLIGFFATTLVLRVKVDGQLSFRELVRRVRAVCLEAYAHQDLPFEKLVDVLGLERDLSRTPLFQVMFGLQRPFPQVELGASALEPVLLDAGTSNFDVTLSLEERDGGLAGWLEYNTDLFDAATIERMVGHYRALLEAAVARPDDRLSALPLLGAAERRLLVDDWNRTAVPPPRAASVVALFEDQVRRTPDALALIAGEVRLSYRELDARAERWAAVLRARGCGPGVRVALALSRTDAFPVTVLAALKAGAAYVPLDPAHPAERIAFLLHDCEARILVTESALAAALPASPAEVLLVDARPADAARVAAGAAAGPDDLAYISYTSGSTGRPKGVAMPHRAVLNLVTWQCARSPGALRTLQFASPSFDVSFQELFATWVSGGCLVLAGDDERRDPSELLRLCATQRIERMFLPFVALHQLAEAAVGGDLGALTLREVITAGEQLRITPAIAALFARLPACRLYNQYGPTETHLATELALTGAPETWEALPSIGRPIANVRVYVLDDAQQPTPIGVPGELYIAGAGLARGYVGRPDLTDERFVPDPFGAPGARMYRTGDRAKYLARGELAFLGRCDDQVKVRGYRVEPGEIEAALGSHPAVREAAVVARADGGEPRLVAYVACGETSIEDLKAHLRARLPDYMVPAVVMRLRALPLTPSGKVDRKALPPPEIQRAAYVAPRTAMEERVAQVWMSVLQVEHLGVNDSFFEVGGHSLRATQVVSRLRAALGVELPVRALFEAPTIAELAGRLEAVAGARVDVPAIERVNSAGPLPLSFAQHRLWFLDQLEPGGFTYNVPLFLRLRGPLDAGALEASLALVARRHDSLRTRFPAIAGEPRQQIAAAVDVPFGVDPVADGEVAERAAQEARRPFDLVDGPLVRARLLRVRHDDHVLVLVMHHIICDGWSMAILVRELGAAYRSIVGGDSPRWPELPVQYADVAAWQRGWLTGARLDEELAYWTRQLADAPPSLDLPTDRPRSAVRTTRGAAVMRALGSERGAAVRAFSQREGVTDFMTLLAAFAALLARYSGQDDIVVGSPIAGRNRPELEGVIGLFVNTLVLRIRSDGAPTFRALVRRVRETCLGAYAHQELPVEALVDALKPDRELNRTPLFQVMFALQNAPVAELGIPGLAASAIDLHPGMAKFDLTVIIQAGPGELATMWEYSTDLFDRATIERMAMHYESLLERLVADPEQRPSTVTLLSATERDQLLALGSVRTTYPEDSLHALFEAQVARTPDATAVVFGDARLSYAELNAMANRLARYLAARGVVREDRVGVCLGRSVELVVSTIAAIKAGACYVPLDPSYPVDRLATMAADAGVRVVIARRTAGPGSAVDLTGIAGAPIWLEDARAELSRLSDTNPAVIATDRDLAYVMYTSGSTGQPKGICIEQRSIARLVCGTDYVQLDRDDVVAHISNTSFDAATFEIWGALLNGATLYGIAPDIVLSPDAFARALADGGITAMFVTAALFHQLAAVAPHALGTLDHLLVGGEVLDAAAVRRVLAAGPPRRLANVYGPTETTTFATWHLIDAVDDDATTIPIGRPIANTTIRILDSHRNLVPVGVRGEIYIGGPGVARGYWNRPALTADRFADDPFDPGGRLYRTGDRAAWRCDGTIEFCGRVDHQVKLNGFRIELGDIEAQLLRCADLAAAAVVVRDDTGERRLVAYAVPRTGAALDADAIDAVRARLAAVLPRYMMPSAIVALERLPMTPNGKIDHRALPAPSDRRADLGGGYVAPEGDLERAIARIWAEVLGVDRVGANDNFFDLGGSSLRLVSVRSRIEALLGRPVPMVVLFQYAQVRSLGAHLAGVSQPVQQTRSVQRTAGARRLAEQRRGRSKP